METNRPFWKCAVSALVVIMVFVKGTLSQDTLGPLNVYRDSVTLSGFSSGGAMAQMLQFSYSSMFRGIAVFSHTFYRCGPPIGDIDEYDRFCTTLFNLTDSELYNTALVHQDLKEYLAMGIIEDPNNLKDKKLYVYTGLRNVLFSPRQALNILPVYEPYIQSPAAIKIRVQDSVQLLVIDLMYPSNTYGGPCNESAETTDFIGNCGFSGVTEAVNFILFDIENNLEAFEMHNTSRGNVSTFDQTEFTQGLTNHNMDEVGYYYVPTMCKEMMSQCYLHFYFHGCLTGREFNGARHVENTGLLELAERKGIIVIFPQAKSSVANPIGCWDTFGVSGKYYATQQGPQVTALKRMLDKILGPGSLPTTTIAAEVDSSSSAAPTLSRVVLTRSSPQYGYAQKLKALRNSKKLTYLPPPPSAPAALAPLRRSAYKVVKRAEMEGYASG